MAVVVMAVGEHDKHLAVDEARRFAVGDSFRRPREFGTDPPHAVAAGCRPWAAVLLPCDSRRTRTRFGRSPIPSAGRRIRLAEEPL